MGSISALSPIKYASPKVIKTYVNMWKLSQVSVRRQHASQLALLAFWLSDKLHLWKLQLPDYLGALAPTR